MATIAGFVVVMTATAQNEVAATSAARARPRIAAEFASYDRAIDRSQRVLVGLLTDDGRTLAFGTVTFRFAYLGTPSDPIRNPELSPPARASFRPLPGETAQGTGPRIVAGSLTTGLYGVDDARFDRPGLWQVVVRGRVDTRRFSARSTFEVEERPQVPAEGDPAPRTAHSVIETPGVDPAALDSRADTLDGIPDPELHRETITDALAAGRPLMVVVSTPTYCTSRFCGPITDAVDDLALRFGDRMAFVHLEVWHDHDAGIVGPPAADWARPRGGRDTDLREPWVFVVDTAGIIRARFDNLATEVELRGAIEAQLVTIVTP